MGLQKYKRMRCFSGLVRLYRGKIFARCVYPYTNARNDMTMRCVVFGLVRLYRGKIFARWVYKNTNACVALFSDWCVFIEVKYLQDGFTKIQTHALLFLIGAFV